MFHIYPVNDERAHDLTGTMCPCGPSVHWQDPETGVAYSNPIVAHNAFDHREIVEEAEQLLGNALVGHVSRWRLHIAREYPTQ